MRNKLLLLILIFAATILVPSQANAQQSSASSAQIQLPNVNQTEADHRAKILSEYLKQNDSPLAPYAQLFVNMADKYNLDWKLVAAISGVESTFGKEIPTSSFNAWGWGVYGDNVIRFKSWEDGIATISEGLREKYMDQWGGKDIYGIGAMYASSNAWPDHVEYYMNQIQDFALRNPQDALSISM
jgi:hypothetical protein